MSAKKKKSEKNSFVVQASILATASLLVRFIGFLYRVPLTALIGDEGIGIYGAGYQIYTFLLILSSAGLPAAISRLVSTRIAKNEYRNAHRVFKVTLAFAGVAGALGMVLLYYYAEPLANKLVLPESAYCMKTLAPTLLIVGFMSVYRGYIQGMNIMKPTAISQIFEQLFNAFFSVFLAWVFIRKSPALGPAGGTAGTGIGAFVGLIIIMVYYHKLKPKIEKNIRHEPIDIRLETTTEVFIKVIRTAFPIIAGTAVLSMTNLIDMGMVTPGLVGSGYFSEAEAKALYGQLSGKFGTLTTLPISISSAVATAAIPNIASAVTIGSRKDVRRKINTALKLSMVIVIPAAVGIGLLGDQILLMLFPSFPKGGILLKYGAVSIIFLSLCQIAAGILQGIGQVNIPVIGMLIGAGVKIILNNVLIGIPSINVVGAVISTDVCYLVAAIFNLGMMMRLTKIKINFRDILIKPTISAFVMGIGCIGFYKLFMLIFGNAISTLLSIIVGMVIYLVVMLVLHGVTEKDFMSIPKGASMVRVLKKVRLMR